MNGLAPTIVPRRSDTEVHFHRREAVLGRRWTLPYEPEAAARQLIELAGGKTMAWRWLTAVMRQVDR